MDHFAGGIVEDDGPARGRVYVTCRPVGRADQIGCRESLPMPDGLLDLVGGPTPLLHPPLPLLGRVIRPQPPTWRAAGATHHSPPPFDRLPPPSNAPAQRT